MLGFASIIWPRAALVVFMFAASTLPTANRFEDMVAQYGVYFFEYYYVGLGLYVIMHLKNAMNIENFIFYISAVLYCLFVYTISIAFYDGGIDKYILRDLRYIFAIAFPILLLAQVDSVKPVSLGLLTMISLAAGAANVGMVFLIFVGVLKFDNSYYEVANNYRYFGLGTYLNAIFFISAIVNYRIFNRNTNWIVFYSAIFLSFAGVMISGYRMMVVAVVGALVVSSVRSVPKAVASFVLGIIAIIFFIQLAYYFEVSRITDALESEALLEQLGTRFYPAEVYLNDISLFHALFGYGFGTTFYIPWFIYQGLDYLHNQIDTTYITAFVKFGAMSIFYIICLLMMISQNHKGQGRVALIVFVAIYMITIPLLGHASFSVAIAYSAWLGLTLARCEQQQHVPKRRSISPAPTRVVVNRRVDGRGI